MCNRVHNNDKRPVPKEGTAWKLFLVRRTAGDVEFYYSFLTYIKARLDQHGMKWNTPSYGEGGFCGFPTKQEGMDALKSWRRETKEDLMVNDMVNEYTILRKVRYDDGIASFMSKEFDGRFRRFIIFKEFRKAA